jgi:hypothetical protein
LVDIEGFSERICKARNLNQHCNTKFIQSWTRLFDFVILRIRIESDVSEDLMIWSENCVSVVEVWRLSFSLLSTYRDPRKQEHFL